MRKPHEILVFVRRGPEFLVLHRAPTFDAYWHVVAGGVEAGETPEEAALRELDEEIGLRVEELEDLRRQYTYSLAEETESVRARFDPSVAEVLVDCYLAEAPEAWEPSLNDEHDRYRWCAATDAVDLLFWPEPRAVLREISS